MEKFFNIIFKCKYLMFGAAPLSPVTRDYFLSLNIFLLNAYGMSECAGATTISDPVNFEKFDDDFLVSTGNTLDGTEILIYRPDKDGNGEICYRGRHIFMGYYKNEDATR
jgi:long-chain-fatty-acid--CoA ligase ACSBG